MNKLIKTISIVVASAIVLSACSSSGEIEVTEAVTEEETVIETTREPIVDVEINADNFPDSVFYLSCVIIMRTMQERLSRTGIVMDQ